MSLPVLQAAKALRDALAAFDPALLSGQDCRSVAEGLAVTEKACGAARILAAARAAKCGAHRDQGFADGADWLARVSGTSRSDARAALDTARAIDNCPDTKAALVAGEVSLAQAGEVVRTEAEVPGAEADLLALARRSALGGLREQARTRRLEAAPTESLYRRQRAAQRLRHWKDGLGLVCFAAALIPEVGVPFVSRLEAELDRLSRQARREGQDESREVLAADAFAALVSGQGRGKAASADLVIVCDLSAYRRGDLHPGEVCHLVDGGPIPVDVARRLGADAFLKAAMHEGVRIETVAHLGRHIPAELRTALELGSPPDFDGVRCIELGCERRYHLEWDTRRRPRLTPATRRPREVPGFPLTAGAAGAERTSARPSPAPRDEVGLGWSRLDNISLTG